ncbi:MAG: RNA 2',3'-cyclic phosphodiesterase [Candidatus Woesearchaeota archaeon]
MRLFIAINFNEFADYFIKLQKQLPEAKHTFAKDFHLTLKFLGEVDDNKLEEIKKILSEIKFRSFNCETTELGYFNKKFLRVIFVSLNCSENIEKLQKKIDAALSNLFKKENNFTPHITIARVKIVTNKNSYINKIKKIRIEKLSKRINSFELIKSNLTPEGPIYEVLGEFKAND